MFDAGVKPAPPLGEAGDLLVRIEVPARADRLKLIRGCTETAALMCGFGAHDAKDVRLAVDEACQNVIRHAYGGGGGDMVLELRRRPDCLSIYLRDFGASTDSGAVQPRDLDDIRPGGLGTHFIREVMDRVNFLQPSDGRGNVLVLSKFFESRGGDHG